MQIPSNLFMNKIGKPGIYLPACMVVWGIISTSTAACQNYGGLIACRFMLGFVEAAYFVSLLTREQTKVHLLMATRSPDVSTTYPVGTLGKNSDSELQSSTRAL